MKTNISLTYYGKPQKQRETYVLFAVTLFFRKTEIESVLCFGLFFCLTLVHLVWAGEGMGGGGSCILLEEFKHHEGGI